MDRLLENPKRNLSDAISAQRSPRVGLVLLIICVVALAIRLPYCAARVTDWDALNYAQGALGYRVAHPPGYVGYCMLGMALNHLVHNVALSYLIIDMSFALAAIVLMYPLARRMGFSARAGLWCVAVMAISFCTLDFSVRISTYLVEAFFAASVAVAGLAAIQTHRRSWAILAVTAWAVGGAFRPSTTLLLAPLVLYIVVRSNRRWQTLALHLLIAVPIIFAWSRANSYYLDAQLGFEKSTQPSGLEGQMLMPLSAGFDLSSMRYQRNAAPTLQYHWPLAEAGHWIELKTGVHLLPHSVPWPAPSLTHAFRQIAFNFAKMAFFLVLCVPALLLVPMSWWNRSTNASLPPGLKAFCLFWFIPPMLFFTFCHFGVYGYLAVLLGGAIALVVGGLIDGVLSALHGHNEWLRWGIGLLSIIVLALWCVGRPLQSKSKLSGIANLMVFDHTGPANLQRARGEGSPSADDQDPVRNYATLSGDDALLRQMHKNAMFPHAYYPLPQPQR